jgi:prevent-host-death family protein
MVQSATCDDLTVRRQDRLRWSLAPKTTYSHNGHVIKTSLAHAKAHLSELVDQAEHKNRRIVILRHGKPAAAIVPVDVAAPKRQRRAQAMSDDEVRAFFEEAAQAGDPTHSAVEDLVRGRR